MKNKIVEDGFWRLRRGQREVSIESVKEKYAKELAEADAGQKQRLLEKSAEEFLRQQNHKPSRGTLW